MPTIIHFSAAFLSKQLHLGSKVYRILPYCLVNIHHLRMMLGGRVALEEGPMIIYGSGRGRGLGERGIRTVPLFVKVFLPVPPPLLPLLPLLQPIIVYSTAVAGGLVWRMGERIREGGGKSIYITILQQCARQGTEINALPLHLKETYATSWDIYELKAQ